MGTSFDRRRLGGVAAGTIAVFALLGVGGTIAGSAQMVEAGAFLATARSIVHLLGIGFSLLLAYYASRARRRFAGGVFATSAGYTLVGATAFAVAFTVMELGHGLGVDVFAFVGEMQMRMAISMVLFTGTVFAFGWAYYRLAVALEGV